MQWARKHFAKKAACTYQSIRCGPATANLDRKQLENTSAHVALYAKTWSTTEGRRWLGSIGLYNAAPSMWARRGLNLILLSDKVVISDSFQSLSLLSRSMPCNILWPAASFYPTKYHETHSHSAGQSWILHLTRQPEVFLLMVFERNQGPKLKKSFEGIKKRKNLQHLGLKLLVAGSTPTGKRNKRLMFVIGHLWCDIIAQVAFTCLIPKNLLLSFKRPKRQNTTAIFTCFRSAEVVVKGILQQFGSLSSLGQLPCIPFLKRTDQK